MPIKSSNTIALALLISLPAIAVDITIPATSITVENLGGQPHQAHHIIMVFILAYGLAQIPVGILADRFGQRPVLFAGLWLFTLAGVAMSYTDSMNELLFWRAAQGIGAATGPVVARAAARNLVSGKALQRLFTTMFSVLAFIAMLAPFFGSLLVKFSDWRAVYSCSIFLGILSILLAYFYISKTPRGSKRDKTFTAELVANAKLFSKTPISVWSCALVSLNFFGYMSLVSGFAIIAKDVYGFDSFAAGAIFTSGVFIYFVASMVNRKLVQKHSARKLLGFAAKMYVVALILLIGAYLYQPVSLAIFCGVLIPYLIAFGFLFANTNSLALEPFKESAGFPSGIIGAVQILIGAVGAFLTSLFYDGTANSLFMVMIIASLSIAILFYWGDKRIR